jgi:hypothetical protein
MNLLHRIFQTVSEGEFSEVAPALVTFHTGHVDQLKAGPKGPALS